MPDYPNRCQHLKINGTQCGSPALRRNRFCFFHKRFQDERIKLSTDRARRGVPTFELPVLEDANSIQIALMQVIRLLVAQQIDHKTASLLLYALQTASSNLRMTRFEPQRHEVVLDPRAVGDTPLDSNLWDDEDFEDEENEPEPETAADRALAALETERKKKAEDEKWRRWAEMQYPDPRKATASAAVTATGSARVTEEVNPKVTPEENSSIPPKKPAAGLDPAKVRQEISDMIRKEFLPGYKPPGGPKSTG
jgi:hypothetical protein